MDLMGVVEVLTSTTPIKSISMGVVEVCGGSIFGGKNII